MNHMQKTSLLFLGVLLLSIPSYVLAASSTTTRTVSAVSAKAMPPAPGDMNMMVDFSAYLPSPLPESFQIRVDASTPGIGTNGGFGAAFPVPAPDLGCTRKVISAKFTKTLNGTTNPLENTGWAIGLTNHMQDSYYTQGSYSSIVPPMNTIQGSINNNYIIFNFNNALPYGNIGGTTSVSYTFDTPQDWSDVTMIYAMEFPRDNVPGYFHDYTVNEVSFQVEDTCPVTVSSGKTSIKYICQDPSAKNYNPTRFGRHRDSWCVFDTQNINNKKELLPLFADKECSPAESLTENLQKGDHNGRYGYYQKALVGEIPLLHKHINRFLHKGIREKSSFDTTTEDDLKKVQIILNQIFPHMTPLVVDGILGPYTRAALNRSCT